MGESRLGTGASSCKEIAKNPLTGEEVEVMSIKGAVRDIGRLKKLGLATLYAERLRNSE